MKLHFQPFDEQAIQTMMAWQYERPYHTYNMSLHPDDPYISPMEMDYFLSPAFAFHAILDEETAEQVAFCSFGGDAQVYGGDYSEAALDIGMGVRPDLTGKGLGALFATAVITFAIQTFQPSKLRVTIANFNQRAIRVWGKNGFQPIQTFESVDSKMPFTIFTKSC
jgi:RimJ/RimL family protein N-acetyltransferase